MANAAHKNTLCGQNAEFLVLQTEIKIMTTSFKGLIKSVASCADSVTSENGIQKKEINRQLDFFFQFSGKRFHSAGNGARESSSKEKVPLAKTKCHHALCSQAAVLSPIITKQHICNLSCCS
jgi:hypothetical protein